LESLLLLTTRDCFLQDHPSQHQAVRPTGGTSGCGTAYFELDTSKVEPAPTGPSTVAAAKAQLVTEVGGCPGEVLVFTEDGYLSWLEVCSWSDDIEVTLAAARHCLQTHS
ncbi:hypothetical protein ACFWB2_44230, partial [Streptomyces virginiae]|uniref:hypothetical protein n=1 Tax=Streptomyces virginiae TaxID=1961 RepID=UPI0036A1B0B1